MSFLRHGEIYRSDVGEFLVPKLGAAWAAAPSTHRLDEFPVGYSLAGCSPAGPASASPTRPLCKNAGRRTINFQRTANSVLTDRLSPGVHRRKRLMDSRVKLGERNLVWSIRGCPASLQLFAVFQFATHQLLRVRSLHRWGLPRADQRVLIAVDDPRKETAEFLQDKLAHGPESGPRARSFRAVVSWRSSGPGTGKPTVQGVIDAWTPGPTKAKCTACIWGCRMPVETIIDQWKTSRKQYRFETFCYGPKSCPFYRAGIVRRVPGRKGMSYTDEDLADEEAVAHRDPDG